MSGGDGSAVLYNSPMAKSSSLASSRTLSPLITSGAGSSHSLSPPVTALSAAASAAAATSSAGNASPLSPASKGPPAIFDDASVHEHPLTFFAHVPAKDDDGNDDHSDVPECAGCKGVASTGYRCDHDGFILCYTCSRTLRIAFRPSQPRRYNDLFAAVPSLTTHELHAADLSPTTATRAITPTTAKAAAWLRNRKPEILPSMAESPPLSPNSQQQRPSTNSSSIASSRATGGTSSPPTARTTSTEVDALRSAGASSGSSCRRIITKLITIMIIAAISSLSTIYYLRWLATSSVIHITDDIPSLVTSSLQTSVLQATCQLGVLDHVYSHGGATTEQLAAIASLHAPSLHRLLSYLATIHMVHATCANHAMVCDTNDMQWWVVDHGMTLTTTDTGRTWQSWLASAPHINTRWTTRMMDMVRTGRNQPRSDIDEWSPLGGITRASLPIIGDWTTHVDWSPYKYIIDIGVGGSGANGTAFDLLLPVLQRYENITGVLFRSDAGIRDNMKWYGHHYASLLRRTQFQGGHWSNSIPVMDQHHDGVSHVFVLNQVMHRVHDDDIVPLLTMIRTAIGRNMNARLIIADSFGPHEYDSLATYSQVLTPSLASSLLSLSSASSSSVVWPLPITDMISLASSGGGQRTHTQWLVWLARSNYRLATTTTPNDRVNLHIMEAVPIAASSPVV